MGGGGPFTVISPFFSFEESGRVGIKYAAILSGSCSAAVRFGNHQTDKAERPMSMPRIPVFPLKVALAVGLPVCVAVLACFAAARALTATHDQAGMVSEVVSRRAEVAVQLERRTLLTAHHLRGYALTGERHFLDEAKKELAEALERLQRLREASGASGQGAFAEEAERLAWLVEATSRRPRSWWARTRPWPSPGPRSRPPEPLRGVGRGHGRGQEGGLNEIAVKYPRASWCAASPEDLSRPGVGRGWPGRAFGRGRGRPGRRPDILARGLDRFEVLPGPSGASAQATEEDAKAIDELAPAGEEFRKASEQLAAEWDVLHAAGRTLALAERDALAAVARASENAVAEEKAGLGRLSAEYALSRGLVWGFLGMTLLFGVAWIVLAVRLLGVPVTRCAAFAVALVRGRVPGGLSVAGRDEVGGLAGALREMSRRFGRAFAR
jgi:methyl-accepting chemotaxis protein